MPLKTINKLHAMYEQGEKIAALTCYDASFAYQLDTAGVDMLVVGDSLGMVIQGHGTTLPVSLQDVVYHTRCVEKNIKQSALMADLPFGSYQESPQQALRSAATLMSAGAHIVKLEGGEYMAKTVEFLSERGIPVCAHLGLTPQSIHQLGGYRVQYKDDSEKLLHEAVTLQNAGARMILLELVPGELSKQVTEILKIPTIGIGAGKYTSGQVLVVYDILGLYPHKTARFVKNFLDGQTSVQTAIMAYVEEVKNEIFPSEQHTY